MYCFQLNICQNKLFYLHFTLRHDFFGIGGVNRTLQSQQAKWPICNHNNGWHFSLIVAGGRNLWKFSHRLIWHQNWSTMLWEFRLHYGSCMFPVYYFRSHHILAHHDSSPPSRPLLMWTMFNKETEPQPQPKTSTKIVRGILFFKYFSLCDYKNTNRKETRPHTYSSLYCHLFSLLLMFR